MSLLLSLSSQICSDYYSFRIISVFFFLMSNLILLHSSEIPNPSDVLLHATTTNPYLMYRVTSYGEEFPKEENLNDRVPGKKLMKLFPGKKHKSASKQKIKPGLSALVTGGASGLGRALCLALAEKGVFVTVVDFSEEKGQETTSLVGKANAKFHPQLNSPSAIFVKCDVTKRDDQVAASNQVW